MGKESRTRARQVVVRYTDAELALLREKMKAAGTKNREGFIREASLLCEVNVIDYAGLKEVATAINRVGNNVNQIAHRLNDYGGDARLDALVRIEKELSGILLQLSSRV